MESVSGVRRAGRCFATGRSDPAGRAGVLVASVLCSGLSRCSSSRPRCCPGQVVLLLVALLALLIVAHWGFLSSAP